MTSPTPFTTPFYIISLYETLRPKLEKFTNRAILYPMVEKLSFQGAIPVDYNPKLDEYGFMLCHTFEASPSELCSLVDHALDTVRYDELHPLPPAYLKVIQRKRSIPPYDQSVRIITHSKGDIPTHSSWGIRGPEIWFSRSNYRFGEQVINALIQYVDKQQ